MQMLHSTNAYSSEHEDKHTPPPVLFVPGALTGEWIWEDNFRDYFTKLGFDTEAMTFSGHQTSFLKRNTTRFDDYLEECIARINSMSRPPIVVAHSMGGLIAMHAATQSKVHALVLLSPVPHTGVAGSLYKLGRKSPLSLLKFSSVIVDARLSKYASPPLGIYSNTCDERISTEITRRLRSESLPVMLKLLSPPKLKIQKLNPQRVLFIAATGDFIIPPCEVVKSAETLGSPTKVYEGFSHSFQAEKSWSSVASDMLTWLNSLEHHQANSVNH